MDDLPVALPPDLEARYEAVRPLGAGAMGTVLLARCREDGKLVAVKLMPPCGDPERRQRFLREAKALGRVRHPRVVGLVDFGLLDDLQYLVLEYLEGRSLEGITGLDDPLPVLLDVAEGLDAVHGAGLVHRDVKPANMILTREGRGMLIDLGLALDPAETALTRQGAVVGSAAFLAPEVIRGEQATPAADWYAWGVSLYQLSEKSFPFDVSELLQAASGASLPPPSFHRLDPQGPQATLIRALTRPDPAERPGSTDEIRAVMAGCALDRRPGVAPTRMGSDGDTSTRIVPRSAGAATRPDRRWLFGGLGVVGAAALAGAVLVMPGGEVGEAGAGVPATAPVAPPTAAASAPTAPPATSAAPDPTAPTVLSFPPPPTTHDRAGLDTVGHSRRLYEQALAALRGDRGEPDPARAAELFQQAAGLGHVQSAVNLAILHHAGQGVPQDYTEAARWFGVAADAGHPRAMARLALLLERGRGVERDLPQALELYRRAAEKGNALAMGNLGVHYFNGVGVARDVPEAIRWVTAGAEGGDKAAQFNLGQFYEKGLGVEVDRRKALELYQKAAAQGHEQAARRATAMLGLAGGTRRLPVSPR